MKIRKGYQLIVNIGGTENMIDLTFTNKDARNEMALAYFQEYCEVFAMRVANWYGENPTEAECAEAANENIYTDITTIVEDY